MLERKERVAVEENKREKKETVKGTVAPVKTLPDT
jgi:hypothetical protein